MVATSLMSVCAILTNLGLRGAFVRGLAADPSSAPSQLAEQLGLRFLLTMLAAMVAMAICRTLRYPPAIFWCTAIGGLGLIATTFAATLADLLQAMHKIKTVAAVNFASGITLTIASVVVAYIGANPIAIATAYLAGPAVSAGLLAWIVNRNSCPISFRWNMTRFVRLLAGSRFFAAQQFLAVGSAQAEALILPQLVGINQFGVFTAGTLLANRLTAIPDGLCTAAYPVMARAYAAGESRRSVAVVFWFVVIAATGGIALAGSGMLAAGIIGRILLPTHPELLATVVRITIWSLPLMAVESVMGYALNAAGKDAAQAKASVPAAIISVVISILLVTTLGVIGACWSMLLRPAVRAAFLTPLFFRTFRRISDADEIIILHRAQLPIRKAG